MSKLSVTQIADASSVTADAYYTFDASFHTVKSVQAVWTASTATVTLKLQLSNNNVTWSDFTTGTSISNASGDVFWATDCVKDALYWRVYPDFGSGTLTTLKAYVAYQERS